MARHTLNLNAVATRTVGAFPKVRVKIEDGVLMVKPTDRVEGKNLPKGEKLVKLSRKNSSTVKFGLRGMEAQGLEAGVLLTLVQGKRGWFALTQAEVGEIGAVRVCKG